MHGYSVLSQTESCLYSVDYKQKESKGVFNDLSLLQKYIVVAVLYGLFILFFNQNYWANILVLGLQILVFVYLLIKKDFEQYMALYLIFSSMSLEFEYMSGEFYGWKNFRILGITVAMWFILPLFFVALYNILQIKRIKKTQINRIAYVFVSLNIVGVVVGIITLVSNDNIPFSFSSLLMFFWACYENITRILVPAVVFSFFLQDSKTVSKIKAAVIAILFGIIIQEIASVATGIMGTMWNDKVLMVGPIQTFAPFILLFCVFEEYNIKNISFIFGAIASFFAMKYSFGSGQFIILFSVPFWLFLIIMERKCQKEYQMLLWGGIIIIPLAILVFLKIDYGDSIKYKLDQAINFLCIWKTNWLENLPVSARFRVEEIRGIVAEYIKKPYFSFLGKGYMGTFKDVNNYFFTCSEAGDIHAFSQFEWTSKAFYSVHESFNKILLTNGLLGVAVFAEIICKGIKNVGKSPFLAIGVMWFIWYWGYSTTYSFFGMVCLFLGIRDLEKSI